MKIWEYPPLRVGDVVAHIWPKIPDSYIEATVVAVYSNDAVRIMANKSYGRNVLRKDCVFLRREECFGQ